MTSCFHPAVSILFLQPLTEFDTFSDDYVTAAIGEHYAAVVFSLAMEALVFFTACHRAIGSLAIAAVRQVHIYYTYTG